MPWSIAKIHLVHHLTPPKPHQNWFNLRRRKILKFPHCLEEWKKSLVFHHNSCFLLLHHVCCIIFPRKKGLINGTMFTTIDVTIKYSILHYFQVLRPTHLSKAPLRSWKPPNCLFPLLHNKLISILLLPLFRSFCLIKASFLLALTYLKKYLFQKFMSWVPSLIALLLMKTYWMPDYHEGT